jgi:predicted amidohydrolase
MTRIALMQATSGIDPAANGSALADAARIAAEGGAAMLFAPEMAGLLDRDRVRATPHVVAVEASPYVAAARDAAKAYDIWIHAGSLPVPGTDGRWRNRAVLIDPAGSIIAQYDKIHLFDVDLPTGESWRESNAYAPGEEMVVADTPLGMLGLTICYDLRFAALFDALGAAGCRAICVPAAFTVPTGQAHWHLLLRARAVEQGCYIVAPAQVGHHADGRETFGHSLVVDPWGEVMLDMGDAPGVGFATIDQARIDDVRARIPAIRHRRPFAK